MNIIKPGSSKLQVHSEGVRFKNIHDLQNDEFQNSELVWIQKGKSTTLTDGSKSAGISFVVLSGTATILSGAIWNSRQEKHIALPGYPKRIRRHEAMHIPRHRMLELRAETNVQLFVIGFFQFGR